MRYILKLILLGLLALSIPTDVHAGEPIKFRLMAPIYVDGKGSGIRQPEGVGCRGNALVVADTGNGRLLRYTMTGETLTPVGDISLPQVPYPIRAQFDSKGGVYALDGKLRRIARIAPSGEFLGYLDLSGSGKGTIIPKSFRIDKNDNLNILDIFSGRVLVVDPEGTLRREIPFPKEYHFFSDLAVDDRGSIFLIDSVGKRVYSVPENSNLLSAMSDTLTEEVNFPISIALDGRGNIYVVDQNGSGIVILGPDGSFRGRHFRMGWKEGFLRYPAQLCIDDNGYAFIADRGNNRVEVFMITQ